MSIKGARDLLIDELKDVYSAEKQAIRAYPRIAKAVSSDELKQALKNHLEQTKGQIERLDRVFEILEKRAGGKTCEAMKGLLEEAAESIEESSRDLSSTWLSLLLRSVSSTTRLQRTEQ